MLESPVVQSSDCIHAACVPSYICIFSITTCRENPLIRFLSLFLVTNYTLIATAFMKDTLIFEIACLHGQLLNYVAMRW